MKRWILMLVVFAAAFGVSGCQSGGLTPEQLQAYSKVVDDFNLKVEEYQKTAAEQVEALKAGKVVDQAAIAKVEKMQTAIDKMQPIVLGIAQAVRDANYTSDDSWLIALQAAQAANQATKGINPYSPLIDLGLGLAAIIAAAFARKKAVDAAAASAKYQAHKQGVELTMKQVSASANPDVKAVEAQLYANIGEARKTVGVA